MAKRMKAFGCMKHCSSYHAGTLRLPQQPGYLPVGNNSAIRYFPDNIIHFFIEIIFIHFHSIKNNRTKIFFTNKLSVKNQQNTEFYEKLNYPASPSIRLFFIFFYFDILSDISIPFLKPQTSLPNSLVNQGIFLFPKTAGQFQNIDKISHVPIPNIIIQQLKT